MLPAHSLRRRVALALLAACLPAMAIASAPTVAPKPARIVIDPGHTPAAAGALGVRGIYEVLYNDHMAALVVQALQRAGFDVLLTRSSTKNISLEQRAQLANAEHADLFLAIHHDSAQDQYLDKIKVGDLDALRTNRSIAGYSLFVSQRNPRFAQSYAFAQLLGEELRKLGRAPTLHHAEHIAGESRELLLADIGVYRFDDLIVLHQTVMPAVLLEVGVIVDPADESYVSDAGNQMRMVNAIVTAVQRYVSSNPSGQTEK